MEHIVLMGKFDGLGCLRRKVGGLAVGSRGRLSCEVRGSSPRISGLRSDASLR